MADIELRNVTRRFADAVAVQQVSFSIRDGEFFILVGPSGCGKSTLLNLITGLEQVSEGEIRVDGQVVNDLDPRERDMAMVFQSYALYPHLSVRDNMAFPLKLAKLPKAEIERRVAQAADILELNGILARKPRALSGGQRQRVAMGRAIVRDPKVFLLDEPLSNLDAKLRVQMRTEIARLQRRLGTTTVYVTHDQTEAMTLGDRIAVMHAGRIMQIGTPRVLYRQPANLFVAGFIGSPAMNLLPGRLCDGRLELPIGSLALPAAGQGADAPTARPLIVGVRPEHVAVVDAGADSASGLVFDARVSVVEWLGADLFVYLDVALEGFDASGLPQDAALSGGDRVRRTLIARVDPSSGVSEGDTLRLAIEPGCLHVFDAASGERVQLAFPAA